MDAVKKSGLIALFDVDGTLTAPRKVTTTKMLEFVRELRKVVMVGVVGGSDHVKISEQLGQTGHLPVRTGLKCLIISLVNQELVAMSPHPFPQHFDMSIATKEGRA